MTGDEHLAVAEWVAETLNGDLALSTLLTGAFIDPVPGDATYPFAVVRVTSPTPTSGATFREIVSITPVNVIIYGDAGVPPSDLRPALRRIHTLLQGRTGEIDGIRIAGLIRIAGGIGPLAETENGQTRFGVGNQYRAITHTAVT